MCEEREQESGRQRERASECVRARKLWQACKILEKTQQQKKAATTSNFWQQPPQTLTPTPPTTATVPAPAPFPSSYPSAGHIPHVSCGVGVALAATRILKASLIFMLFSLLFVGALSASLPGCLCVFVCVCASLLVCLSHSLWLLLCVCVFVCVCEGCAGICIGNLCWLCQHFAWDVAQGHGLVRLVRLVCHLPHYSLLLPCLVLLFFSLFFFCSLSKLLLFSPLLPCCIFHSCCSLGYLFIYYLFYLQNLFLAKFSKKRAKCQLRNLIELSLEKTWKWSPFCCSSSNCCSLKHVSN